MPGVKWLRIKTNKRYRGPSPNPQQGRLSSDAKTSRNAKRLGDLEKRRELKKSKRPQRLRMSKRNGGYGAMQSEQRESSNKQKYPVLARRQQQGLRNRECKMSKSCSNSNTTPRLAGFPSALYQQNSRRGGVGVNQSPRRSSTSRNPSWSTSTSRTTPTSYGHRSTNPKNNKPLPLYNDLRRIHFSHPPKKNTQCY